MCSTYNPNSLPDACTNHPIEDKIKTELSVKHNKSNVKLLVIVFSLLGLFLIFAYVFYKRKIRRELNVEMMNQVNQAVA